MENKLPNTIVFLPTTHTTQTQQHYTDMLGYKTIFILYTQLFFDRLKYSVLMRCSTLSHSINAPVRVNECCHWGPMKFESYQKKNTLFDHCNPSQSNCHLFPSKAPQSSHHSTCICSWTGFCSLERHSKSPQLEEPSGGHSSALIARGWNPQLTIMFDQQLTNKCTNCQIRHFSVATSPSIQLKWSQLADNVAT